MSKRKILKITNACCLAEKYGELFKLENSELDRITTSTCTLNEIQKSGCEISTIYENYTSSNTDLGNYGYRMFSKFSFPSKEYVISVVGTYREIKKMTRYGTGADLIEINLTCHNSSKQIIAIGKLPFIHFKRKFGVKLPPYFDIEEIKRVAHLLNCLKKLSPWEFSYIVCCNVLSIEGKGISGKVLKPISLYNIRKFKKYLVEGIEIWGCGGIETISDFKEYERAGVTGVQLDSILMKEGLEYTNELIRNYRQQR